MVVQPFPCWPPLFSLRCRGRTVAPRKRRLGNPKARHIRAGSRPFLDEIKTIQLSRDRGCISAERAAAPARCRSTGSRPKIIAWSRTASGRNRASPSALPSTIHQVTAVKIRITDVMYALKGRDRRRVLLALRHSVSTGDVPPHRQKGGLSCGFSSGSIKTHP
jgi:hypothetical protein